MIIDNMQVKGRLGIVLKDKNGNVKETREVDNLVVTAGLEYIASRMVDADAAVISHMGLGDSSIAANAAQTDLQSLVGSRAALASTTLNGTAVAYVADFGAGDSTGAITEAGLFNASTGGTMLCRTVFDVVNKSADDSLSITWTVTIAAAS